jgi:hypothetical protein
MAAEKSSPVSITGKISFTMRILALAGVRAGGAPDSDTGALYLVCVAQ